MRWRRRERALARTREERERAFRDALQAALDDDLDAVEADLSAIVRADSDEIDAYLALGRLYRRRGEIGRAIRIHQNLLLRSDLETGQRQEALEGLARDFQKGGFLRRALAAWHEVLEGRPRHPAALEAIVRLHADAREFDDAIAAQRKLGKIQGEGAAGREARLQLEMAEAAHLEGRSDDARKALRRALKLDASLPVAWARLGDLEAERGRSKKAIEAWRQVVEVDRRAAAAVYPKLETGYAAIGKGPEFETLLRGLLAERPGDVAARLALARHLAARGEVSGALDELQELLDANGDHLPAQAARAGILVSEGRDAEAVTALDALLGVLDRQGLLAPRERLE